MPRRSSWRDLIPGLVMLTVVVVGVIGVLVWARPGALHGDTYRLYVATDAARGVMEGTEVRVAGQKVGIIREIAFRPVTTDTARRLLLELELYERVQPLVRANSVAQIRSGGSLIGAPVLFITAGTTEAPVLASGDTVRSLPQGDTEEVTSRLAQASRTFPVIMSNIKVLAAQLRSAEGTIGAATIEGTTQLGSFTARASELRGMAFSSNGTIGRALDPESALRVRAASAMARADSLQRLLGSESGELGRFRRDSTLLRSVADARNELAIVRLRLARAEGTVGRALHDEIIERQLADAERSLTRLLDDIRHNPLRYLVF